MQKVAEPWPVLSAVECKWFHCSSISGLRDVPREHTVAGAILCVAVRGASGDASCNRTGFCNYLYPFHDVDVPIMPISFSPAKMDVSGALFFGAPHCRSFGANDHRSFRETSDVDRHTHILSQIQDVDIRSAANTISRTHTYQARTRWCDAHFFVLGNERKIYASQAAAAAAAAGGKRFMMAS